MQVSPTRLPTAQQVLLVYNGVCIIILAIGVALVSRAMLDMCLKAIVGQVKLYVNILDIFQISELIGYKPRQFASGDFVRCMSFLLSGFAILVSVGKLDRVFDIKDEYGNSIRLSEELIVSSSFLKNERQVPTYQAHSAILFCKNLDADVYVSPSQESSISNEVFTAKLRKVPFQVSRYEYGVSRCHNSNRASMDRPIVRLGAIFTGPAGI